MQTDIVARFEQNSYFVNETDTQFEVCVLVEGRPANSSLTLHVMSQNNSAEGSTIITYIAKIMSLVT